jgi:uncharacterized protein YbbK (DUF523 family)
MAWTPSLPLVAAWWRQHGLQERVQRFCSTRQPTPRLRAAKHTADPSRSLHCFCNKKVGPQLLPLTSRLVASSAATHVTAISPVLLVSACLLGYPVTYRGTDVRLPATVRPTPLLFLTEVLWRELGLVQCIPVCPEVELLGLPVPRPPLRLTRATTAGEEGGVCRVVDAATTHGTHLSFRPDVDELPSFVLSQLALPLDAVDGVVLKSRSPSCGVLDARLYAGLAVPAVASSCDACPASSCKADGTATPPAGSVHGGRDPHAVLPSSQHDSRTHAAAPYELVDGFFTTLLRNSLTSRGGLAGCPQLERHRRLPPPVITSDRLLRQFCAAQSPAALTPEQVCVTAAGEVGPQHTSLEAFMESALQHHHCRLARPAA